MFLHVLYSQYDFANLNLPSGSTTGSPFITASNYVMDFESYSSTDTSGVPVWEVPAAGDITTAGGDISVACACSVTSDQATCTISAFDTITGKIKWSIALADQSVVDAGVIYMCFKFQTIPFRFHFSFICFLTCTVLCIFLL